MTSRTSPPLQEEPGTARDQIPSNPEPTEVGALVEELREKLARATPRPWKTDVRIYSNGCFDAHWAIQTVDKQPEHPWSPRVISWMTGTVRSDLRVNDIVGAKYCRECDCWHLGWREVGVDVRADPKTEADATLIVAAINALPTLLDALTKAEARVRELQAAIDSVVLMDSGLIIGQSAKPVFWKAARGNRARALANSRSEDA